MSERIYDIDYSKLVGWLTPEDLRKNRLLRFIAVLIAPLVTSYQSFLFYRKAKIYQLTITPQKCYLERLLNDRYDYSLRRIYIDDGQDKPPYYIFEHAEEKPKFIRQRSEAAPAWIFTDGESGAITDDFIVFVPVDVVFEVPEMTSLVKAYKLAGTKFKIQTF
ncbi:MAG: hypothetical protein KGM16_17900 [Bacteroidota bacterium]|nr:hypothetical protein [Bacteroidota bacterium]